MKQNEKMYVVKNWLCQKLNPNKNGCLCNMIKEIFNSSYYFLILDYLKKNNKL